MSTKTDAKERLLLFLDENAFEPVLRELLREYAGGDRESLEDAQRRARVEQRRFHSHESAKKIKEEYELATLSKSAREIDRKLRRLHLPTLLSLREEFEELCEEVGVD